MRDSRLRELERRAASDPDAYEEFVRAHCDLATWDGEYRRLQLMSPKTKACKENGFPANHFAAAKDTWIEDLGEEVSVLFFKWRPRAIRVNEDGLQETSDANSKLFKEIEQKALASNQWEYMCGPQFLVWCHKIKETLSWFCFTRGIKRELNKYFPPSTKLAGKTKILFPRHHQSTRWSWTTIGIRDEHTTQDQDAANYYSTL